jgi:hypothetical protein
MTHTPEQVAEFKARLAHVHAEHEALGATLTRFKALMVSGQRIPPEELAAHDARRNAYLAEMVALGADVGMDMSQAKADHEALLAEAERMAQEDPRTAQARANAWLSQWANEDHGVPVEGNRRLGRSDGP